MFFPFTQISSGNPYLKILDLSKLFVTEAHMKRKKSKNLVLPPSQSTYGSKKRPCIRGLSKSFALANIFFTEYPAVPDIQCIPSVLYIPSCIQYQDLFIFTIISELYSQTWALKCALAPKIPHRDFHLY